MESMLLFLLVTLVGYFSGSICSAILVSRLFNLPDPRAEGSKNPGATNVLRLAGKRYAVLVLIMDMLKGFLPVIFAKLIGAGMISASFTCLATVLGHMYPVFFHYQGGKGVATALGAFLGLHFLMGIATLITWLMVANFLRYSSLASLIAVTFVPFYSLICFHKLDSFLPLLGIALLILYKHRDNITRLTDGTEPQIRLRRHQINDVAEPFLKETVEDDLVAQNHADPLNKKPNENSGNQID